MAVLSPVDGNFLRGVWFTDWPGQHHKQQQRYYMRVEIQPAAKHTNTTLVTVMQTFQYVFSSTTITLT